MLNWILLGISVLLIISGLLWIRRLRLPQAKPIAEQAEPNTALSDPGAEQTQPDISHPKQSKRSKILAVITVTVGGFLLLTRLLDMVFGSAESDSSHAGEVMHISIFPERVNLFGTGFSVGETIIYSWIAMAILIIGALILRFRVFKNPKDVPTGAQNVIETIIDAVGKYTNAQAHGTGEMLCSYILTVAAFMVASAFLELFRLRAPTSDISVTFSLAFLTFCLINVYGIKRKGVLGRIKSLAAPTPLVFPFRLVSEFAIPISMACRLFGNMLGGLIVVDLLYSALGNNAVGIPAVFGLYFNAFHPLIQAFIFVTLTLAFINEAIEVVE